MAQDDWKKGAVPLSELALRAGFTGEVGALSSLPADATCPTCASKTPALLLMRGAGGTTCPG